MPGGGLEADESLRDACEREYREETGIEVECTSLAIASEFFWDDQGTPAREYGFFFLVSPRQPMSEPRPSIRSLVPGVEFRWFDLDELALTHYLKSCELEIRDRLHQMQHLDKILDKLVEQNGGQPVTREQFLENDATYWERRFADQAMDEMVAAQTGISIGNLHSMRRASAPAIVDKRNELPNGYVPLNRVLEGAEGRAEFLNDLQKKVLRGIEDVTGENLGLLGGSTEEQKKLEGN